MPVEPPVTSPRDLAEAYAIAGSGARPADRRRHGPDGRAHRRDRRAARPHPRPVAARRAARHRPRRRRDQPRCADDLHGRSGARRCVASISPCWSRRPRRSVRPRSRTAGTLGGNVANASPAGDTLPVFLAADAAFVLGSARGERTVPAARVLAGLPADGARAGRAPAPHPDPAAGRPRAALPQGRDAPRPVDQQGRGRARLARRSAGTARQRAWTDVRLALGSVAATPIRARATEAALEGRPPTPETADRAAETLAAELHPIDDVRSTAEYRRLVAARVLHRLIREAGGW